MQDEIWYPLKCNGVYLPFLYAVDDYLDRSRIRKSKEDCQDFCDYLNKGQQTNEWIRNQKGTS